MPGRLEFNLGLPHAGRPRGDSEPMRCSSPAISAAGRRLERVPLDARRPVHVDVDNFDDVHGADAAASDAAGGRGCSSSRSTTFTPTSCSRRLTRFESLRRARLQEPPRDAQLLGRLLGTPSEPEAPGAAPRGFDAFIHSVVAPHVVKDTSAEKRTYLGAVDAAIGDDMRALLHDPAFQALEAAWRGVRWMVSNLELDENLQLHLLDVTRDELARDVVAARGRLDETGVYRQLVDASARSRCAALVRARGFVRVRLVGRRHRAARRARPPRVARRRTVPRRRRLTQAGAESGSVAPAGAPPQRGRAVDRSGGAACAASAAVRHAARPDRIVCVRGAQRRPAARRAVMGQRRPGRRTVDRQGVHRRAGGTWSWATSAKSAIFPAFTVEQDDERVLQPCTEHLLVEREIDAMLKAGLIADCRPSGAQPGGGGSLSVHRRPAGAAGVVSAPPAAPSPAVEPADD